MGTEGRRRGVAKRALAARTAEQVAAILGTSRENVSNIERKALRKMAAHPLIRDLARQLEIIQESE